jgi:hypothetical protein
MAARLPILRDAMLRIAPQDEGGAAFILRSVRASERVTKDILQERPASGRVTKDGSAATDPS